jgi:hypothetical protein
MQSGRSTTELHLDLLLVHLRLIGGMELMLTPKSMTSRQKYALYPSYYRVESKDVSAET